MVSDVGVDDLWSHVVWSAKAQLQRLRIFLKRSGEAKVWDFDAWLFWVVWDHILEKDIIGLQVTMHDSTGMYEVNRETDLSDDVASFVLVNAIAPCDELGQWIGEQLHHAENVVFVFD